MGKPAARLGDSTAHGGVITVGCPTVLIGGAPAARVGDMHVCPMLNPGSPPPPHVGGPISLGSAGVMIGGMPAARMGDMATCSGPPDSIVMGCPTVLIGETGGGSSGGGGGAAAVANAGAHAALVGEPGPEAEGPHWIDIQFVDSAGNPVTQVPYEFTGVEGQKERGRLTGDAAIRRGGLPEAGNYSVKLFSVFNAKWSEESARVGDVVELSAETEGYEDGTKAVFRIWERDIGGADDFIAEIVTTVDGNKVEAQWTYEYHEDIDEVSEEEEIKGYSSPEYYFLVRIKDDKARSDLLEFRDWIEIELRDEEDNAVPDEEYILFLSNGEVRKGKLDKNGMKKETECPPSEYSIEFSNFDILEEIE